MSILMHEKIRYGTREIETIVETGRIRLMTVSHSDTYGSDFSKVVT